MRHLQLAVRLGCVLSLLVPASAAAQSPGPAGAPAAAPHAPSSTQAATAVLWEQLPHDGLYFNDQCWTTTPEFDLYCVNDVSTSGATWNVSSIATWYTYFESGDWDPALVQSARVSLFPKSGALPVDGVDLPGQYTAPCTLEYVLFGTNHTTWQLTVDTSGLPALQGLAGSYWVGVSPITPPDDGKEYHYAAQTHSGDDNVFINPLGGFGVGTGWQVWASGWDLSMRLEGSVGTPDPWTDLGCSLPGAGGAPQLVGTGPMLAGTAGSLGLGNAATAAPCLLFTSLGSAPAPFKGGTLCAFPIVLVLPLVTDGSGAVSLSWTDWPGGLSGQSLAFQCAIQDAGAVQGAALSNALRADVP